MSYDKIQFSIEKKYDYQVCFLPGDAKSTIDFILTQSAGRLFFVVDKIIQRLYPDLLAAVSAPILYLSAGENIKTMANAEIITQFLQQNQCHLCDALVVIGGGCIGDVAGFAASIYKRGIPWFFIPTTLLSQVDSSIGGKVAINTDYGKNQLGSFWPARRVLICDAFLKSLDARQYSAGMAEIIKVSFFSKGVLLQQLHASGVLGILELLRLSVMAKLEVIGSDWYETRGGTRAALNFGHTIGHALEKVTPELLHGEAVALGMLAELYIAKKLGETTICVDLLAMLLRKFKLPTEFHNYLNDKDWSLFLMALQQDKKNEANRITFVLPGSGGEIKKLTINPIEMKDILF